MVASPHQIPIYHITDVANLASIIGAGGLYSDAKMIETNAQPLVIGYSHIKQRRLVEYRIPCCANRFVGEFVPFYYCPRSPMLYTINRGNTDRPAGSQTSIVHLVSSVGRAIQLGRPWAVSDGNAGAAFTGFSNSLDFLAGLNWNVINSNQWAGQTNVKQAEFLVADFFPWTSFSHIVCHNEAVANQVHQILGQQQYKPIIQTNRAWYY